LRERKSVERLTRERRGKEKCRKIKKKMSQKKKKEHMFCDFEPGKKLLTGSVVRREE